MSPKGLLTERVVVLLKLAHETRIGLCVRGTAADKADRIVNAPTIGCHQVRRNDTCAAAHPLHTVHEHASALSQCVADESARAREVVGELVKGGVANWDLKDVWSRTACFREHDWIGSVVQKGEKIGRGVNEPLPDMTDRTCVIP